MLDMAVVYNNKNFIIYFTNFSLGIFMNIFTKQITLLVAFAACALPAFSSDEFKPKPVSLRSIFTSLIAITTLAPQGASAHPTCHNPVGYCNFSRDRYCSLDEVKHAIAQNPHVRINYDPVMDAVAAKTARICGADIKHIKSCEIAYVGGTAEDFATARQIDMQSDREADYKASTKYLGAAQSGTASLSGMASEYKSYEKEVKIVPGDEPEEHFCRRGQDFQKVFLLPGISDNRAAVEILVGTSKPARVSAIGTGTVYKVTNAVLKSDKK